MATTGLVVVLVGIVTYLLWASHSTFRSAQRASHAIRLSDDYAQAAAAVAAEESVERKYRLEPGPTIRAEYDKASQDLYEALARIRRDGGTADEATARRILAAHEEYLAAAGRLFAAVDRKDTVTVLRVDNEEVDPRSVTIHDLVGSQSAGHHEQALRALANLQSLQSSISRATPAVLLVGLILIGLFTSVLHRVQRERRQAVHDSQHDALTGLANRTLLADRFDQALRLGRRERKAVALLLIDLDRFKEVNDTLGHHVGDELLVQIGPRMALALRQGDTIARLGGDEFAIVLPGVEALSEVFAVAELLRAQLLEPFQVGSLMLHVEASIGVVLSGTHGDDAATLLQRADIAMYTAKQQKLGVSVYDIDADEHSLERLTLLPDLHRALAMGELVVHFQPQLTVQTDEVRGAEALVRWNHPTRGQLGPDAFVPMAEETGLIVPLTHRVLDVALSQARRWLDAGQALRVSVNLSTRNLLDDHLDAKVAELLRAHRVPATLLMLEITESAIMAEPVRAAQVLGRLHDQGVRISIDDFGVGYTNLGQLRDLPVDELKVDRSFVIAMSGDRRNQLIVRSVVDLGRNLGLSTVAEGVETAEALKVLASYGCDIVQGNHLSAPLPPDEFDRWRSAWVGAARSGLPHPRRPESDHEAVSPH